MWKASFVLKLVSVLVRNLTFGLPRTCQPRLGASSSFSSLGISLYFLSFLNFFSSFFVSQRALARCSSCTYFQRPPPPRTPSAHVKIRQRKLSSCQEKNSSGVTKRLIIKFLFTKILKSVTKQVKLNERSMCFS